MRTALFWVITQRIVVISYRRFGTTHWSHFQCSRSIFWGVTWCQPGNDEGEELWSPCRRQCPPVNGMYETAEVRIMRLRARTHQTEHYWHQNIRPLRKEVSMQHVQILQHRCTQNKKFFRYRSTHMTKIYTAHTSTHSFACIRYKEEVTTGGI